MNHKLLSIFLLFLLASVKALATIFYSGTDKLWFDVVDDDEAIVTCPDWEKGGFYQGDVTIPETVFWGDANQLYRVTGISHFAFYACPNLTSVSIPNSVTSIGNEAFGGCSSLTSITIPQSMTSIGRQAFYRCYGLTYIFIPQNVTSIEDMAFASCTSLKAVTISEKVTSIGWWAFSNCPNLTDVYCYAEDVPDTDSRAFSDTPIASATLHVPQASIEAYSTTEPWSVFGRFVPIEEGGYAISDLSELRNDRQYVIHTKDKARGSLGVSAGHLATTNPAAAGPYKCSPVVLDKDTPLITSASQLSSPYTEPTEGSFVGMIDGDAATFWHSTWTDGSVEPGQHYFQVEMAEPTKADVAFQFIRRKIASDQVIEWGVYGTNNADADKEECAVLAVIGMPYSVWGETRTSDIFSTEGYKYIRFYLNNTTTGNGFGHIAEFQLYPATLDEAHGSASPFAILQRDGGYYLYSVIDKAFISYKNNGDETAFPWQQGENQLDIYKRDGGFVFDFKEPGYSLNVNDNPGIAINTWGTATDLFDDGNQFTIEEVGSFDPTEALAAFDTYELRVPDTGLAALYTSRKLAAPDDIHYLGAFYSDRVEGEQMYLARVGDVIPAGEGVIVMANPGTYILALTDAQARTLTGNLLQGTFVDLPVADVGGTVLTLGDDPMTPGFFLYEGTTLPAFSVFLSIDEGVKALRLPMGGIITDIAPHIGGMGDEAVYNLAGQRLSKMQKGLNICGGRKVVLR